MSKMYKIMRKMEEIDFNYTHYIEFKEDFAKDEYTLKDFLTYLPLTVLYYILTTLWKIDLKIIKVINKLNIRIAKK